MPPKSQVKLTLGLAIAKVGLATLSPRMGLVRNLCSRRIPSLTHPMIPMFCSLLPRARSRLRQPKERCVPATDSNRNNPGDTCINFFPVPPSIYIDHCHLLTSGRLSLFDLIPRLQGPTSPLSIGSPTKPTKNASPHRNLCCRRIPSLTHPMT